jgi:hypothetical protein
LCGIYGCLAHAGHPGLSWEAHLVKPEPPSTSAPIELSVSPPLMSLRGDRGGLELAGANAGGMDALLVRAPGESDFWLDNEYRLYALQWKGPTITHFKRGLTQSPLAQFHNVVDLSPRNKSILQRVGLE